MNESGFTMRWLPNISSASALAPHSAASSPKKTTKQSLSSAASDDFSSTSFNSHQNINSVNNSRGPSGFRVVSCGGGGPKLTRQRKLRHLTDQEVNGTSTSSSEQRDPVALSRSQSSSASPSPFSTPASSSTSTTCSYSLSRMSPPASVPAPLPLPLPLPVPENPSSVDGEMRFPSPKERGDVAAGDGGVSSASPAVVSKFSIRRPRKKSERVGERSSRMVHMESSSVVSDRDNFRVSVPIRSAPTSPFASPVVSPERTGTAGDLFHFYQKMAKAKDVWSAPEMATLDFSGLPPPAFFDVTAFSTNNSPLHSPCRSPRQAKSPSRPSSPINAKLGVENSHGRWETNANIEVHPLPLPPGAAVPSLSAPVQQAVAKPESVPMKCQWQKGKLIGRGTFGSVYVATSRETGALCAMKEVEMFPDDPKCAESIKQLQQEIKVLSQLKHPNIVQYYGSEIVGDRFYIYLEYVHPGSINRFFREHCREITESVVRSFTRHILSGLAYLHSTKTIHRDIKGANLLVDAFGVVKLADFGMAKHLTGQAADLSLKGSPYWMAPELMQVVMQKDASSDLALAVDIWSLGCTIIEMFTGKPPWSEYEGAAAMFKVLKDKPPIPEALSHEGKDFLQCCLRRNPAERPTASVLLEHRWLKNSQQLDVSATAHLITGTRTTDLVQSPSVSEVRHDQSHVLPSSQRAKAKLISNR